MGTNRISREKEVERAVDQYIARQVQAMRDSWGPNDIRNRLYKPFDDAGHRSVIRHDLWVQLDRGNVPAELPGFTVDEIRWWFMKGMPANDPDLALQKMIDMGQISAR